MEDSKQKTFQESLIIFFNSKTYFFIRKVLDFASVTILGLIFWYLYKYIDLLKTNPCSLCEDMGMTCFRMMGFP